MICWICNVNDTDSHEHRTKRSDLKLEINSISQNNPIYLREMQELKDGKKILSKNKRIGSFNAEILKYQHTICHDCNTSKSQKHDKAWENFSKKLKLLIPLVSLQNQSLRFNKIFPYKTSYEMQNVHLFFVKLFGCQIIESEFRLKNKIPIDIKSFSEAILNQRIHPRIYLSFKYRKQTITIAENSDVHVFINEATNEVAYATWLYCTGNLVVNIMYALPNEKREGLKSAWHPRLGYKRFTFEEL